MNQIRISLAILQATIPKKQKIIMDISMANIVSSDTDTHFSSVTMDIKTVMITSCVTYVCFILFFCI